MELTNSKTFLTNIYDSLLQLIQNQKKRVKALINLSAFDQSNIVMKQWVTKDFADIIIQMVQSIGYDPLKNILDINAQFAQEYAEPLIEVYFKQSQKMQTLDLTQHNFNIQMLSNYSETAENIQFDRIIKVNDYIITAEFRDGQECRLLDRDLNLIQKLDLKAERLLQINNEILSYCNNKISIISGLKENDIKIQKDVYKTNHFPHQMVQINDDIFMTGQLDGSIQLFSLSKPSFSQTFRINQFTCVYDICLIAQKQNENTYAVGDNVNGIAIIKIIKKRDFAFELIEDPQRLIDKGDIDSIILINQNTLAFTCEIDGNHYLKIYNIELKNQINSIKLQSWSYLYGIDGYDYDLNPFAFIKELNQVSVINFRNYQIVKVVDSEFSHRLNKSQCLVSMKLNDETGNKYKLYDVQVTKQDSQYVSKLREIIIQIP
ncbi:UNKNOWN [Stylonychia lemnae]|uniref:Uncharacterized protein n=1 Tax=Stylonychia lemnae TaxID=5949 RepID=A0A078A6W2_STYLE|nr:UNKNOWN [Stylonychia lemnae]|eukprot:CDW77616.1 UNKNOWN [Stylonychia lemnae]